MNVGRADDARCRCGGRLAPVRSLDPEELRGIVVRWPAGVVVDVRACDACGTERACLRRCADRAAG
jgi:hypothetical protein